MCSTTRWRSNQAHALQSYVVFFVVFLIRRLFNIARIDMKQPLKINLRNVERS